MSNDQELNSKSKSHSEQRCNDKDAIKNPIIADCWGKVIKAVNSYPKHLNGENKERLELEITQALRVIDDTSMVFIGTDKHGLIESIFIESCSKSLSRDLIDNCPEDNSIFKLLTEYRMPSVNFDV